MTGPPTPLELRPDRREVARWVAGSTAALAVFVWAFVDSAGHPLAWVALTFGVIVAAYFVLQLVAPSRFVVRLEADVLTARFAWSSATVSWDDVNVARVSSLAGEPYLELEVRDHEARRVVSHGVLLPVGCDLAALHAFLARRLGRGGLRPPRTFTPIDLDEEAT